MNKTILGLLLGGFLGILDGLSAWFWPEAHSMMLRIVIGSTIKGIVAGVLIGFFARKVNNVALGTVFGLAVGALLAFGVGLMEGGHYFEIMLPGSILGLVVGLATQKFPARA